MRAWLRVLLLLVAAVALALWLRTHDGNVILAVPPWRIQFSTTLGVLLLIALFIALHLGLRVLIWLGAIPTRLRDWRDHRIARRDHELLERGWVSLMAGDYLHAERDLARLLAQTRIASRKAIAALAAARAAQARGQAERCQTLLTTAQDYMGHDPALQRAVAATRAEILLDLGQPEAALAQLAVTSDSPHTAAPTAHLAHLRLRALVALAHHDQVFTLARQGLRQGWLTREVAMPLIDQAGAQILQRAVAQAAPGGDQDKRADGSAAWLTVWKDLKSEERLLPRIARVAAEAYSVHNQPEDAARVLEAAIKEQLSAKHLAESELTDLLATYARCDASQVSRRLTKAETWLSKHPDQPQLLCALATLCLTGQIWGAAERYLHRSLQQRQDAYAHTLLGSLYDRLGRASEASRHWQQAAALGMALPALTTDAPLPAADTHADPPIAEAAASSLPAPDGDLVLPATLLTSPAQQSAATTTTLPRTDIEDLFDSAPIPGLAPVEPGVDSAESVGTSTSQPSR